MPVVAQVWSRGYCRVFAVIAGRRGADVSGRSVVGIPDKATRDALIRDKISNGNGSHTLVVARPCLLMPPPGGCVYRQTGFHP